MRRKRIYKSSISIFIHVVNGGKAIHKPYLEEARHDTLIRIEPHGTIFQQKSSIQDVPIPAKSHLVGKE